MEPSCKNLSLAEICLKSKTLREICADRPHSIGTSESLAFDATSGANHLERRGILRTTWRRKWDSIRSLNPKLLGTDSKQLVLSTC